MTYRHSSTPHGVPLTMAGGTERLDNGYQHEGVGQSGCFDQGIKNGHKIFLIL
jgi:hypothetical protein